MAVDFWMSSVSVTKMIVEVDELLSECGVSTER